MLLSNPLPAGEVTPRPLAGKPCANGDFGCVSIYECRSGSVWRNQGQAQFKGHILGNTRAIEAAGNIDVPDFQVSSSPNHTGLKSEFTAVVNARNGNVDLKKVLARARQTTLLASGRIAAQAGKGRSAEL